MFFIKERKALLEHSKWDPKKFSPIERRIVTMMKRACRDASRRLSKLAVGPAVRLTEHSLSTGGQLCFGPKC